VEFLLDLEGGEGEGVESDKLSKDRERRSFLPTFDLAIGDGLGESVSLVGK
jgi:hypothetical protein